METCTKKNHTNATKTAEDYARKKKKKNKKRVNAQKTSVCVSVCFGFLHNIFRDGVELVEREREISFLWITVMTMRFCGSINNNNNNTCRSEALGRRLLITDAKSTEGRRSSRRRALQRQRRHRDDCVRVSAYGGAKVVDPLVQLERLFPDVPAPVLRLGKTAYDVVLEPLYDLLPIPDAIRDVVEQFVLDEKVNSWTLYTDSTPTNEFLLVAFVAFYLTAQPGILGYAFDETIARAIQTATAGNKFGKRGSNVTLGGRIGDGSFGTVYRGRLNSSDAENLVLKFAKNTTGASGLQRAERHMNERISRDIFVAGGCASYVGSYEEIEDAAAPVLVWKFAGDENTLEDYVLDRNFPSSLEVALFGKSQDDKDYDARCYAVAKKVTQQLLWSLRGLHSIGIVHRDVKPANLVNENGRFKLIDFGGAADLRSGVNYEPEVSILDPSFSPPEDFIMPERTPRAPPGAIAGALSVLPWTVFQPQLFDSYSAGLVLLQLGCPQLRGKRVLEPSGSFQRRLQDENYDLRKVRKDLVDNLGWDFSALDRNGGAGFDLACRLIASRGVTRRGRLDATQALLHPFVLLPF